MDFLNNAAKQFQQGSNKQTDGNMNNQQGQSMNQEGYGSSGSHQQGGSSSGGGGGGGFLSGLTGKLNNAAGGGEQGEKNEDYLDKAIDMVQEKVLGQGPQNNESAIEQAKDEQISDFIRAQYKSRTGKEMPIKDKPTTF